MEAIWCACYSANLYPLNDDTCSIATLKKGDVSIATEKWDDVSIATVEKGDVSIATEKWDGVSIITTETLDDVFIATDKRGFGMTPLMRRRMSLRRSRKSSAKSYLPSMISLLFPMAASTTAQDVTIDEMRDDATSLNHQTTSTRGNDLAPNQVNYLSEMKKCIMDKAGETNSTMEERDGAESALESKNSAGDLIADVDNGGREGNEVKNLVPDSYLQSRVKSAPSKKGALIVEDNKSVITTPTSFAGAITTAKVKMTRMAKAEKNVEFKHFQVVLSGRKSTDMMVRLPYNRNATFQDLRRELEEDYADDFPSSDFRFTLTADGISVSPMQEEKWRVRDYVLTNQGGDGTYKNPHHVYMKRIEKGEILKSWMLAE